MEIYLKHRNRKQFICITKKGKGSIELDVYLSSYRSDVDTSVSNYDEDAIDERHSWYSSQREHVSYNGKWVSVSTWNESTKAEFMAAYAEAQNSLFDFNLLINRK